MVYVAFVFALALACVAGMEFISLMVMETRVRQLKRRVRELEEENVSLSKSLREAELVLQEHYEEEEEAWPELIDDNTVR